MTEACHVERMLFVPSREYSEREQGCVRCGMDTDSTAESMRRPSQATARISQCVEGCESAGRIGGSEQAPTGDRLSHVEKGKPQQIHTLTASRVRAGTRFSGVSVDRTPRWEIGQDTIVMMTKGPYSLARAVTWRRLGQESLVLVEQSCRWLVKSSSIFPLFQNSRHIIGCINFPKATFAEKTHWLYGVFRTEHNNTTLVYSVSPDI